MIDWISNWLKEIILIVLLASFVDLLLPSSSMQKYTKLILGLLIILTIISPLLGLFSDNYSISSFVRDIESQDYSRETMASEDVNTQELIENQEYEKKMVNQVEQSMLYELKGLIENRYEITIVDLKLSANIVNNNWVISQLYLSVTDKPQQNNQETNSEVTVVEEITEIEIDINQQMKEYENVQNESINNRLSDELKEVIHKEWGLPKEVIVISYNNSSN